VAGLPTEPHGRTAGLQTCFGSPRRATVWLTVSLRRFHRDQGGSISIVSVFAVMLLAMLLGMVLNIGQQADSKVKMQNAADSATYAGGVVMARGMNSLAFTNHLLFDVFALTAFLREGGDNHGQPLVPEILAAWSETGPKFQWDGFQQFQNWNGTFSGQNYGFATPALGDAIVAKVPLEQQMVDTYSAWAAAFSEGVLPAMEEILADELIPHYQRTVVLTVPGLAQMATNGIAVRHGHTPTGEVHSERGPLQGMLWTGFAAAVGLVSEDQERALPVVDPVLDVGEGYYRTVARQQRKQFSEIYRRRWNREKLAPFYYAARMSQYYWLWDGFTRAQLRKLINENPDRNLPYVILTPDMVIQAELDDNQHFPLGRSIADIVKRWPAAPRNELLETRYMFVGTTYWKPISQLLPGLFVNPLSADYVTYSQIMLFVPRLRLVRSGGAPMGTKRLQRGLHYNYQGKLVGYSDRVSVDWNLLNQNWRVQLVPATHRHLGMILQEQPPFEDGGGDQPSQEINLPDVSELSLEDLNRISHH
jgi:hypothetical protein